MENQSSNNSLRAKLPALLSGSEYKTDDSDIYRVMNLLGRAITIVVHAKKDGVSDDRKKAWLTSFEKEYKRAQLYHKKTINFDARHSSHITPIPDDTDCASPIYKMIFDWLRKSLLDSPNWERLYQLIKIQTTWLRDDRSADWWNKVKSICRKVETAVDPLDPIAEIWTITEEYHAENEMIEKANRTPPSGDEPHGKSGQRTVCRPRGTKQASRGASKLKAKPARDQVFICYSRKDKRWLADLQTHLKPYGSVTVWSDEQIAPGAEWFVEIKKALGRTKVGILLVTPDFLASDFIHKHELTPLLKEAEKGNVRIIWIPVRACSYKETPLERDQAARDPAEPLAKMKKADRDEAWVGICEKIKKAVGR